jgi:hypothetical protein
MLGEGISWSQEQWDKVLELFGHDEFNVRVWGTFAVSFIVYWSLGGLFTLIDVTGRPKFMLTYRVQDNVKSYPVRLSPCYGNILLN